METTNSPEFQLRNGISACIRKFVGNFTDLMSYLDDLLPGTTFPDISPLFGVNERTLTPRKGWDGIGDLTVILTDWASRSQAISEVEYEDLVKDMLTNPVFQVGKGGAYQLTQADVVAIQFWKNETDYAARSAFQYYRRDVDRINQQNVQNLSVNAAYFAAKLLLGIDSYVIGYPVYKLTEAFLYPPTPLATDVRCNPTQGTVPIPSGWDWLRKRCRIYWERYRFYYRYTEYVGAVAWDHDLYPSA